MWWLGGSASNISQRVFVEVLEQLKNMDWLDVLTTGAGTETFGLNEQYAREIEEFVRAKPVNPGRT